MGPELEAFEAQFEKICGVKYTVGVGSGTDAIELALRSVSVKRGEIVLVPSHTAIPTISAIRRIGAVPYFLDIDKNRFTMAPASLENALRQTKAAAIIAVHLYGCPADMHAITTIAREYNIALVEDCAQAHGAEIDGQPVGSWGDVAAFSFYPTKNFATIGDAGAVSTTSRTIWNHLKELRQYGWNQSRVSHMDGVNSRMDEIHAAVLQIGLKYIDESNFQRKKIAELYDRNIDSSHIIKPTVPDNCVHVYHQYVVRVPCRDLVQQTLYENNIATAIHYPIPCHQHPAYEGCYKSDLDVTEKISREILSLPIYPSMIPQDVHAVSEMLNQAVRRYKGLQLLSS